LFKVEEEDQYETVSEKTSDDKEKETKTEDANYIDFAKASGRINKENFRHCSSCSSLHRILIAVAIIIIIIIISLLAIFLNRSKSSEKESSKLLGGECRVSFFGSDYRGSTNTTTSGRVCQPWASQSPHQHSYLQNHPDAGLDGNFCRNPDGYCGGLWCHTMDPNVPWDLCDIPLCQNTTSEKGSCQESLLGTEYRGNLSKTVTGKICQAWDTQVPHEHEYTNDNYPKGGLDRNYCRNPDDYCGGVWCYTTDPSTEWDLCSVPLCSSVRDQVNDHFIGAEGKLVYKFHTLRTSWSNARRICEETGASLAMIKNKEEQNFLARKFTKDITGRFWIGVMYQQGDWTFVDETPVINPFWWRPNNPDGLNQQCVYLNRGSLGHWGTIGCNEDSLPFLCQKEIASIGIQADQNETMYSTFAPQQESP